jgi:phospholipase A1/A2
LRSARICAFAPRDGRTPRTRGQLPMPSRRRLFGSLLLLLLTLAAPAAHVQAQDAYAKCRTIADPAARLACYDSAAAAPEATSPAATSAPRPPSEAGAAALADLQPTGTLADGQSLIAQRWELEERYKRGTFRFTFYRPNYILPIAWSSSVNNAPSSPTQPAPVLPGPLDNTETEFQLSFKLKLWQNMFGGTSDLWLGYTQKSYWQVYNEDLSRAFRETNYEPELIWSVPTDYTILGLRGRLLALGLVHQSNGRGDPLSRSWNRVYAMAALERGPFVLQIKPWYRIDNNPGTDDNPDIVDYIGSVEFLAFYKWLDQFTSTLRLRTTFSSSPSWGSAQLDLRFPIVADLRGYLQVFSGYGESMIDYNFRKTAVGLGVSIGTWY